MTSNLQSNNWIARQKCNSVAFSDFKPYIFMVEKQTNVSLIGELKNA